MLNLRVLSLEELGRRWESTGEIVYAVEIANRAARGDFELDMQTQTPTLSPQEIREYENTSRGKPV